MRNNSYESLQGRWEGFSSLPDKHILQQVVEEDLGEGYDTMGIRTNQVLPPNMQQSQARARAHTSTILKFLIHYFYLER